MERNTKFKHEKARHIGALYLRCVFGLLLSVCNHKRARKWATSDIIGYGITIFIEELHTIISDVKVTPGTKNADSKLAIRKTQLVRRKSTAAAQDQYPEIKSTNFNRSITPPTTEEPPTFTSFEPAVPPTALP